MVGLFFGGTQFITTFGNQFGNIELDANLEEAHEWTAQATENPVEEGAPISDHVIEQSDKLRISGFITDAPLVASQSITGSIGISDAGSRTQPVFDLLYTLIKKREPIVVYTKHAVYSDMVLTTVNIPRTPGVGEAIEFNAEFIQIRKVATKLVDVPVGISQKADGKAGAPVQKKAQAPKYKGKTETEDLLARYPKRTPPPTSNAKVIVKIGKDLISNIVAP